MGLAAKLPWQAKLLAKLVLARLPVPYSFWRFIGLFKHGEMNQPDRAIRTFRKYLESARQYIPLSPGFESLELGPGDSILSGLVARADGASKAWLVDAGNFAITDLDACKATIKMLQASGATLPDIANATRLSEVLALNNIHYLTQGTASLAQIPDASIDFIWSQVVLEHVPKAEFAQMARELRRIMKPGGIGVHSIDFRDHLSGGLNNLRFPSRIWESYYFHNSGFYTNRLRPREILEFFVQAGFKVEVINQTFWPNMPIVRDALAPEFQHLSDEDFMVAEIEIIIRPNNA